MSNTNLDIKETPAKSILTKSNLPDCDYVVNPYTGCRFGCTYCYASFMSRYVGKDIKDWGNFVYIKTNAPELLEKEIKKIPNNGKNLSIFFSSVTDPYQGLEAKYKITRKCLEVISLSDYVGLVSILTKSNLVTRDIDIFKKLKNVEVGLTITSTNDNISRYFEKFAPNVSERYKALKILNDNNIKTYVFVGPLLPHFVSEPKILDDMFKQIKETGTNELYVEHINLKKHIIDRLINEMPEIDEVTMAKFYKSQEKSYRNELNEIIMKLIKKYEFKLRLNETLYHPELASDK